MALLEKQLFVRKSTLPGSGKGLFTRKPIPRGTRIVEYEGRITSWKDADHRNGENGYIYYVNRNHVIDARPYPSALARYANDARGLSRVPGIRNNAEYAEDGLRVYITAIRDIPANGEILVGYGKEYWDAIRDNLRESRKEKAGGRKDPPKRRSTAEREAKKSTGKKTGKKKSAARKSKAKKVASK